MKSRKLVRFGVSVLCVFALTRIAYSQTGTRIADRDVRTSQSGSRIANSKSPLTAPIDFRTNVYDNADDKDQAPVGVEVLYTGRLMGYFRVPDLQLKADQPDCKNITNARAPSASAMHFFEQRKRRPNAILVGTGDNFAPALEARTFEVHQPAGIEPANKEYYQWNQEKGAWLGPKEYRSNQALLNRLEEGRGTIPTDNVGCFLAAAGYSAIVPGKHDFYFGPERLRELARLLAGITPTKGPGIGDKSADRSSQDGSLELQYQPVQMLAANLVMKTDWQKEVKPARTSRKDHESNLFHWHWVEEFPLLNLNDGGRVYPWFSSVRVKLKGLEQEGELLKRLRLEVFPTEQVYKNAAEFDKLVGSESFSNLTGFKDRSELDKLREASKRLLTDKTDKEDKTDKVYLCLGDKDGDPDEITAPDQPKNKCSQLKNKEVRLVGNAVVMDLVLEPDPAASNGKNGHYSTLLPGTNYGLCLLSGRESHCIRFSVHVPFFSYPSPVVSPKAVGLKDYTDPDPYVFVEKGDGRPSDVAIFGVVDTNLAEHVGILNLGWLHKDTRLKTVAAIEDPAEALHQQLEYFERKYCRENGQPFAGIKMLLAQMSPQRARILSARLPEFQIVVSAADQDQDTVRDETDATWSRPKSPSATEPDKNAKPTVFAVPAPYFNTGRGLSLNIGLIALTPLQDNTWKVHLKGLGPKELKEEQNPATQFWDRVASRFGDCEPSGFIPGAQDSITPSDRLKWFTLCAMQHKAKADVALIQKRDLFSFLPNKHEDGPEVAQRLLDRIIWKGDFLTVLYVPGSSLLKAMALSKKFDEEDSTTLSLENETGRGLVKLGIRYDKEAGQYLVNEVPVEPSRLYAVATTDYIGAGDTGYPELATDAISAPRQPSQFPNTLASISTIVCRSLYPNEGKNLCYPDLPRDDYFDRTAQKPTDSREGPNFWSRVVALVPFHHPDSAERSKLDEQRQKGSSEDAANRKVEERLIWDRSTAFTFGFNSLINNLSDAAIDENFSGIPTSSVKAHSKHSWNIDLKTSFSRSLHDKEFFIIPELRYNVEYTGRADKSEEVNQISNLITLDSGLAFKLSDRALPHWELVPSVHLETPTRTPITVFELKTGERKDVAEGRGLTFLPRLGLKWQSRVGSIEIGGQGGWELNALNGYQFKTDGFVITCRPEPARSFAKCVKDESDPSGGHITAQSDAESLRQTKPRAGAYLKTKLTLSPSPKVSYVLENDGDFFLENPFKDKDNATDTRFRLLSSHKLKFAVFSSLAIGPAYRLFLYENKVNHDFLLQQQFMFDVDFGFDIFNWRGRAKQVRYRSKTSP